MDQLIIPIPDGLDEQQKSVLAKRLTEIAEASFRTMEANHTDSPMDLAGCLKGDQPAGTREQERDAARRHVLDSFVDGTK